MHMMETLSGWLMGLGMAKPVLTALVLPPLGPLVGLLLGLGMLWRARPHASGPGRMWVGVSVAALWIFSCQSTAVWLARHALPVFAPVPPAELRQKQVDMIVVLGGGIDLLAPEYGTPQLSPVSMERLRYVAWLARETGLPLGFAGGVGWGNAGATGTATSGVPAEATLAASVAPRTFGVPLSLADATSRDTHENAVQMARLLKAKNLHRIALVTSAWHLPRAQREFARTGLDVVPAPMGFTGPYERGWLDALPSGHGMMASRQILREWLGLMLTKG